MVDARPVRHPELIRDEDAMKTVQYESTLFYYDGPQVFEARDAIGGHYVAVMVDSGPRSSTAVITEGLGDRYLVAGVAPERLRQFRAGAIDLTSLLIDSDEDERYVATAGNGLGDALTLERLKTPLIESGYLPERGFLLHDHASEGTVEEKDDGLARLHHRGSRSLSR